MLYFVSTPIGNLADMTYRGVAVLKEVDVIACEDTRHTLPLLNRYDIKKQLVSYQKFNEAAASEKIIEMLKGGKTVAVVSDAGTPLLSDPGAYLVKALLRENLPFTLVPGANAILPALTLSGLKTDRFSFIGFLPEKNSDCESLLASYEALPATLIFYCAPHDLKKTVARLFKILGDRKAVAVKELTKLHEARYEFTLSSFPEIDERGEFVILVEGSEGKKELSALPVEEHIALYLSEGLSKMEAIKRVAKERGVPKSSLYKYTIEKSEE